MTQNILAHFLYIAILLIILSGIG